MRHLLDTEIKDDISLTCVNGYIVENTTLCICYKGWTTNSNSVNECDVDTGANNTNSNNNPGIVYSNNDIEEKSSSASFGTVLIYIIISILILALIFTIILCIYKKFKDIRLLKEKIKNEKNKKKDVKRESNESLDIEMENKKKNKKTDETNNSLNDGRIISPKSKDMSSDTSYDVISIEKSESKKGSQ